MAQKPETSFSKLLHSKLDKDVYFEKISSAFRRGQPDFYYEGPKDIAWIEHKWILKPWLSDKEPSKICSTTSWTNQRHWLERAHKNGKQAYVIIGVGKGRNTICYILSYPYAFDNTSLILPIEQAAKWIEQRVL